LAVFRNCTCNNFIHADSKTTKPRVTWKVETFNEFTIPPTTPRFTKSKQPADGESVNLNNNQKQELSSQTSMTTPHNKVTTPTSYISAETHSQNCTSSLSLSRELGLQNRCFKIESNSTIKVNNSSTHDKLNLGSERSLESLGDVRGLGDGASANSLNKFLANPTCGSSADVSSLPESDEAQSDTISGSDESVYIDCVDSLELNFECDGESMHANNVESP